MKLLEAFCAYMEGIATGIRVWLGAMAGILALFAIISLIFVKDITPEQLGAITRWALSFGAAGLFCPPENTWMHWKRMLERKNTNA